MPKLTLPTTMATPSIGLFAIGLFAIGLFAIGLFALPASAGVIEDRKANFKANNISMRAIGAALSADDFDRVASEAAKS